MEPERPEREAQPQPPPGPAPDEATLQRRVFMVRMAAWGTVLLLAVIAFNMRAGASAETDQGANGPQVNGRTSEGQPIWSISEGGKVREIEMSWRFRCDGGGQLEPFGGTFRDSTDDFEYDGARFSVAVDDQLRESPDGWTPHLKALVRGESHADGRTAGTSSAVMWFTRGGERGAVCRSATVRWSTP